MTITTLRPYITDPFVISKMIPSWTTHLAYADKLYFVAASYCNGDNQISQSGSRNLLLVFSVSLRIETELNTFEIGANKRLAGSQTRNARLSFQTDASGAQFKIFSLNECVLFFNPIFSECLTVIVLLTVTVTSTAVTAEWLISVRFGQIIADKYMGAVPCSRSPRFW